MNVQGGQFFLFLNSFRWLLWVLAVVLLALGTTPQLGSLATAAIYVSVLAYNSAFTIWSRKIESWLRGMPSLLLVDLLFCTALLAVYGWASPFYVYSFSPIMLAGYLFKTKGGFVAACLGAAGYGLSTSLFGHTWSEIQAMGLIDSHLFQFFDYFLVAIFFAYPAVLSEQLRLSNEKLADANQKIEQAAMAAERQRIAYDIHDGVTQSLLALGMMLDSAVENSGTDAKLKKSLGLAKQASEKAIKELRLAVDDLLKDTIGAQTIAELAGKALAEIGNVHDLKTDLEVTGKGRPPSVEEKKELYLIIKEVLNNVAKHAQASLVTVHLCFADDQLELVIADDGCGVRFRRATGWFGFGRYRGKN